MASSSCSAQIPPFFFFFFLLLLHFVPLVHGLSNRFYASSCPNLESIVRSSIQSEFASDSTAPAAMLRLLFHDCQVGGCDGSILLDAGSDGSSEMGSGSNLGIRRLDLIDNLKGELEGACPETVSCADIVALAAREAVLFNGGPDIAIPLGRLDGFDTSQSAADSSLPSPSISVPSMLSVFAKMGMSTQESVAILGAHTIGASHCSNFQDRLYPTTDPNMQLLFASQLMAQCPAGFPVDGVAPLDSTSQVFDNVYYNDVTNGRGLLTIDSELGLDPLTSSIVNTFAANRGAFFNAFSSAFVKLSSFRVITSPSAGEVRINCHFPNN